jgi:hypothetical protein
VAKFDGEEPGMTAKKIAEWMLKQLGDGRRWLVQRRIAREIRDRFGEEHVYKNKNRNWAISTEILEEFRTLTENDLVWSRSKQAWRRREPTDGPGRMIK